MSLRQIAAAVCLALLLGFSACGTKKDSPAPADLPNFIIIVTDDQRWDTLEFMPKLRRLLGAHSITFTQAFVTTPRCCPSRASILTGQYAHNTGVLTNGPPDGGAEKFKDASSVATWLQQAGYRTALVGKYLNWYYNLGTYVPPGWDEWRAFSAQGYFNYLLNENGKLMHYSAEESDYSTDLLARRAVGFLEEDTQQPFFLYFAPFAPHSATGGGSARPAPRHAGLSFPDHRRALSHNEPDIADKPAWLAARPALSAPNVKKLDDFRADQLRSLQAVDEALESMLLTLKEQGRLNNTLVLFTSDNGLLWGEHRLQGKQAPYEEAIRVPFVLWYPKLIPEPRQEDQLVLNIDIAPTLADLAGVTPSHVVDGRSLRPLLENNAESWRTDFLLEHWAQEGDRVPSYAAVRSQEWKYVEYSTGEIELYRLETDPYELENLTGQRAHSATEKRLAARLRQLEGE